MRGFPRSNGQSDAGDGDSDCGHSLQGKLLLSAGHDIEQNPYGSGVLQDDRDGHAGLLDGHVIEIIRRGYSEHAQNEALQQVCARQVDALPSAPGCKQW